MAKIGRGVTISIDWGEYEGREMQILVTVVNFLKLSRFKQIIRRVDLDTFVVFTDSL